MHRRLIAEFSSWKMKVTESRLSDFFLSFICGHIERFSLCASVSLCLWVIKVVFIFIQSQIKGFGNIYAERPCLSIPSPSKSASIGQWKKNSETLYFSMLGARRVPKSTPKSLQNICQTQCFPGLMGYTSFLSFL